MKQIWWQTKMRLLTRATKWASFLWRTDSTPCHSPALLLSWNGESY